MGLLSDYIWIFLFLSALSWRCWAWDLVMTTAKEHVRLYGGVRWLAARDECANEGGSLLIMRNKELEELVYKGLPKNSSVWIGGQRTSTPDWRWLEGNRKVTPAVGEGFLQDANMFNCAYLTVVEAEDKRRAYIHGNERCYIERQFMCKKLSCNSATQDCFYSPSDQTKSWEDARRVCENYGVGELATYSATVESGTPDTRYEAIRTQSQGMDVPPGIYWIGLRYTGWKWHDGTEIIFGRGTELSKTPRNPPYNCLQMSATGIWISANCENTLPYLCYFNSAHESYRPPSNGPEDEFDPQNLPWTYIIAGIAGGVGFIILVMLICMAVWCICRD